MYSKYHINISLQLIEDPEQNTEAIPVNEP